MHGIFQCARGKTSKMKYHLYQSYFLDNFTHKFYFIHWPNCTFVNRCDTALQREFPITDAASTLLMVHDNEFHFWYQRNNGRRITITIDTLIASPPKVTPNHDINIIDRMLCAFDTPNNINEACCQQCAISRANLI